METSQEKITVETIVNSPVQKVWQLWSMPQHIVKWNSASEDWHTPRAENDLRAGGRFLSRMEAKDGSFGFDFSGIYEEVIENQLISYSMADGRKVSVIFESNDGQTKIIETFDPENINPRDMQTTGWQAILNNFKKYAEAN